MLKGQTCQVLNMNNIVLYVQRGFVLHNLCGATARGQAGGQTQMRSASTKYCCSLKFCEQTEFLMCIVNN